MNVNLYWTYGVTCLYYLRFFLAYKAFIINILKPVSNTFLLKFNRGYSTTITTLVSSSGKLNIEPKIVYSNADTQKLAVLNDNKNLAGVYRWVNLLNQKSYIGSSINLSRRLRDYYTISFLEIESKKNNSMIYKALLKYGYSSFRLEILEHCDGEIVIEREQYYLNTLNPEYNILKIAGSLKGFKHSEATIERMRKTQLENKRIRTFTPLHAPSFFL
uniref:GIY-YIG endonuclease n=1 Tax=Juglanconis juglandina TaxID=1940567 RepID=A0A291LIY5_9PEZI|nr:GIY-YIG endonuclease [Juglanconis juglandina]